MDDFSNINLLPFVIFILSLWLLALITFILSFSKHKYISTLSFLVFVIICIYWGYVTADGISLFKHFDRLSPKGVFEKGIPLISCILSFVSGVLWFTSKRKIARRLGLISIIAIILVYTNI